MGTRAELPSVCLAHPHHRVTEAGTLGDTRQGHHPGVPSRLLPIGRIDARRMRDLPVRDALHQCEHLRGRGRGRRRGGMGGDGGGGREQRDEHLFVFRVLGRARRDSVRAGVTPARDRVEAQPAGLVDGRMGRDLNTAPGARSRNDRVSITSHAFAGRPAGRASNTMKVKMIPGLTEAISPYFRPSSTRSSPGPRGAGGVPARRHPSTCRTSTSNGCAWTTSRTWS